MSIFTYLLDEAAAATEGGETSLLSSLMMPIMLVVMIVVFWLFIIRPQKKQDKEINEMRNSLQVGDEVTTIGGIIGEIISIKDETVVIETSGERTKMRILRSAIKTVDVHASEK